MDEQRSHPGYRQMRLNGCDYSARGLYFVTICASQRRCIFSKLRGEEIKLTPLGEIVRDVWFAIPQHFATVILHSYVVMPNHFHGIVELGERLALHAARLKGTGPAIVSAVRPGSLSAVVRSFKAEVTRRASQELRWQGRVWQPNYYDRVIRDGREFAHATRYISENPLIWMKDPERTDATEPVTSKAGLAQHAARLQRIAAS